MKGNKEIILARPTALELLITQTAATENQRKCWTTAVQFPNHSQFCRDGCNVTWELFSEAVEDDTEIQKASQS